MSNDNNHNNKQMELENKGWKLNWDLKVQQESTNTFWETKTLILPPMCNL